MVPGPWDGVGSLLIVVTVTQYPRSQGDAWSLAPLAGMITSSQQRGGQGLSAA